jgi:Zn-dependent protease
METISDGQLPIIFADIGLAVINLLLIWLLMVAPVGRRRVTNSSIIAATPEHIWSALFPLGANAKWDGNIVAAHEVGPDLVETEISYDGRDGKPIRRTMHLESVVENCSFTSTIVEDTSLDHSFWSSHSETVTIEPVAGGSKVTISEIDKYRGFAFLVFRYFKNRRGLAALSQWAKTGNYKSVGIFERPPVQIAMAAISALILWPFFGLTKTGLTLSIVLTLVVALHEAGHMFAFRMMGHKSARMIFIPLLGGIALGGRPYDRNFEVGFSALMGAGMSVFPVVMALTLYGPLDSYGWTNTATVFAIFGSIGAIFNLANLVPVWKFDGGQVIRQIFDNQAAQGLASFTLLGGLMYVGRVGGFEWKSIIIAGVIFSLMSVMTTGNGFKPRYELTPMNNNERMLLMAGLVASFAAHASCAMWGFSIFL